MSDSEHIQNLHAAYLAVGKIAASDPVYDSIMARIFYELLEEYGMEIGIDGELYPVEESN